MKFKATVNLTFESECIKDAREKLKYLTFVLKQINQTDLEISKEDTLFNEVIDDN
jgi:hypothetical protein